VRDGSNEVQNEGRWTSIEADQARRFEAQSSLSTGLRAYVYVISSVTGHYLAMTNKVEKKCVVHELMQNPVSLP
jgi:hypothetical protein